MTPTTISIHTRADQLVHESHGEMTRTEAYRELSRRGHEARKRRRGYTNTGILRPTRHDRTAFSHVEPPANAWWLDKD